MMPLSLFFLEHFFFPPKKITTMIKHVCFSHKHWSFFLGKHLLNTNNNQTPKVHEIIFLFKMYVIFVMIRINTIGIIIMYLKCLTYCSCLTYYSWSNYA
jgi:hypothetical protein